MKKIRIDKKIRNFITWLNKNNLKIRNCFPGAAASKKISPFFIDKIKSGTKITAYVEENEESKKFFSGLKFKNGLLSIGSEEDYSKWVDFRFKNNENVNGYIAFEKQEYANLFVKMLENIFGVFENDCIALSNSKGIDVYIEKDDSDDVVHFVFEGKITDGDVNNFWESLLVQLKSKSSEKAK